MDKNLVKIEKEKAKKQVKEQLKQILTDKKGYWVFNLLVNVAMFIIIFLINHIFHTDIDNSGTDVYYDSRENNKEEKLTLKKILMDFLIIVVVCFVFCKVLPFISDILFNLN